MNDLKQMYKTVQADPFPESLSLTLGNATLAFAKRTWDIGGETKGLRYGENPDQPAALYELAQGGLTLGGVAFRGPGKGLVSAITEKQMLQAGKHPGKINLTDVDNGLNILQYLSGSPTAVILKHNNPCGAARADSTAEAVRKAFAADRIAAFGGTVVVNRPMDKDAAAIINSAYFEVVAAPAYEEGAFDVLASKKNLRILEIPGIADLATLAAEPFLDVKSLMDGGLVLQFSFRNRIITAEDFLPATAEKDGDTFAARKPTPAEAEDLLFAWAVEAGVTSNSILLAKDGATVAVGTGEQDRVGCVQSTVAKAYTKHKDMLAYSRFKLSLYELALKAREDKEASTALEEIEEQAAHDQAGLPGSVAVSDGFFPFRDGVDLLLDEGVAAIAQPGGSIRDHEVIQAVNQADPQAAMVFTGQRSFRH